MEHRSLIEYVENFRQHGRECAYVDQRGYRSLRRSYGQTAELAWQFAQELEKRGIGKGNRVLIWGRNCAEWVAAFFGCTLGGAVIVPMDDAASSDFALRVHQQVDAKLVLCSRQHAKSVAQLPAIVLEDLPQAVARHSPIAYSTADLEPSDVANAREEMISNFDEIIGKLGGVGASERAARAIVEEIGTTAKSEAGMRA